VTALRALINADTETRCVSIANTSRRSQGTRLLHVSLSAWLRPAPPALSLGPLSRSAVPASHRNDSVSARGVGADARGPPSLSRTTGRRVALRRGDG